jgi:hypothetical protein
VPGAAGGRRFWPPGTLDGRKKQERNAVAETLDFRIRKAFLLPLGLLLLLCLVLLVCCFVLGEPPAKAFILIAMILPVLVLFVESVFRHVVFDDTQLTAHKLLRNKTLSWADITAVETVMVRKRAFLTICAGEEFLILSNAYADFPDLVRNLLERVQPASISEETRSMAEAPPIKSGDIVSCWLAVALLLLILYGQLGGSL